MTVPSKKLMGVWAFVDTCLLVAGILTLVVSIVWRTPDLIRDLIISKSDLMGALHVVSLFELMLMIIPQSALYFPLFYSSPGRSLLELSSSRTMLRSPSRSLIGSSSSTLSASPSSARSSGSTRCRSALTSTRCSRRRAKIRGS